jgi:hypothetical protein
MRSRPVRLTFGAMAWIALAAAAFFLVRSEKQISTMRGGARAFDLRAHEASDALSDLRAAQQAYVAVGQGVEFWMPKVAQTAGRARTAVTSLQQAATSAGARSSLDEAAATLAAFAEVDKRARDYLSADQQLMAGDVIFTEGGKAAATAARQVEEARLAEHQEVDRSEAEVRIQQAMAAGGGAGLAALIVLLLALVRPSAGSSSRASESTSATLGIAVPTPIRSVSPVLKAAAGLCTDFGRLRDLEDLTMLLERAAEVMDASGLVVWLGGTTGGDLQPVLTHGYSEQMRARMPNVPRSGDNAAAAAYRTGQLQIVMSRPGVSSGAIVAPILAPDGCVGALSAEIRHGGEASESVQALAAIFASQLAPVLATAPAPSHTAAEAAAPRATSSGVL